MFVLFFKKFCFVFIFVCKVIFIKFFYVNVSVVEVFGIDIIFFIYIYCKKKY